jgi:hypothetical protein
MHPKVLGDDAWTLVRRLVKTDKLAGWILAGGTGLALQFGHRISEDLDLFNACSFEPESWIDELALLGNVQVQHRAAGTLHVLVEGIRISLLHAQAPFLFPGVPYRGMTIADCRDIAVMKLVAVGGRGSRKDFVDLFFLIQNGVALETAFELLRKRFSSVDYNEYHILKSLVWFEDAETEPMPNMIRDVTWEEIKRTIESEVKRLA